jgi:hypothetical protein
MAAAARKVLTKNAAQCLQCMKIVESKSVHDFVECGCPNGLFVDGGLEYARMGAENFKFVKKLHEWSTPPSAATAVSFDSSQTR